MRGKSSWSVDCLAHKPAAIYHVVSNAMKNVYQGVSVQVASILTVTTAACLLLNVLANMVRKSLSLEKVLTWETARLGRISNLAEACVKPFLTNY